ncbi:hypothetical protein V6N12_043097 [Hibiscus sabdariffa]|uniref:RNase H type-1 domain-containing protein n=1 Tax=Hibiscus sabdariffa TaxID=183260 RepID=A0ABR2DI78_9ROSI
MSIKSKVVVLRATGISQSGVFDVTTAKLLAIKEAVSIFQDSAWHKSFHLILKTDCTNCEQWLRNPILVPAAFKDIVDDILNLCSGLMWEIKAIPRIANGTADRLAKSGILRDIPFLWKFQC